MQHSVPGSRRESLDSVFMKNDQTGLPPLFDFSALGKKDAEVFNTGAYTNALLATGIFRIWPSLLFMACWSTMVYCINRFTTAELFFPPTLLTVFGTVLGFVVSYRTSSAYERWAEGRRMWSNITLASRTWARTIWIACPDSMCKVPPTDPEERKIDVCRAILEKKSCINLAEGFGVSLKHYLRGEEGVYYEDLYPLVKHLPGYNLPASLPSPNVEARGPNPFSEESQQALEQVPYVHPRHSIDRDEFIPMTEANSTTSTQVDLSLSLGAAGDILSLPTITRDGSASSSTPAPKPRITLDTNNLTPTRHPSLSRTHSEPPVLKPSRNPPPRTRLRERWPFRLMVSSKERERLKIEEGGRERREQRELAKRGVVSSNVPYELTLYMAGYIAALTRRDSIDVPTKNSLLASVQMMTDSLTSLERILTTPIPFSYAAHIWSVAWVYCILVPFQLVQTFGWVTIPATVLVAFIFITFISIENPFGFDRNDLNLDLFNGLLRAELAAITSRPSPTPEEWVFTHQNDSIFGEGGSSFSAVQLQTQGLRSLRNALARQGGGGIALDSILKDDRFAQSDKSLMSPGPQSIRRREPFA
ncbi:Bestrophin, RFP-TM, chloride channel-domain-containing protein [Mrakia frigida]|uniref:Bestrophin, RFP-TM, chloride channel-domain-containing protein n=1 Tax=Mrakia frigida TaxID=29902 RepID=UPI003FCC205B